MRTGKPTRERDKSMRATHLLASRSSRRQMRTKESSSSSATVRPVKERRGKRKYEMRNDMVPAMRCQVVQVMACMNTQHFSVDKQRI